MTGSNLEHQSFPFSKNSSRDNLAIRNLDSDTKGRFVGLVVLAVFSVWIVAGLCANFYSSVASKHWPTAAARIVTSGVYSSGKGVGVSWAPKIEYEYEVAGIVHRSSKIRYLMRTFYDQDAATDVQTQYRAGSDVRVSYDPKDPNRSVLEPGMPPGMWTQGLIALFFFGLCGYIFFEITHPHRRLLLHSNPIEADRDDEGQDKNQSELA